MPPSPPHRKDSPRSRRAVLSPQHGFAPEGTPRRCAPPLDTSRFAFQNVARRSSTMSILSRTSLLLLIAAAVPVVADQTLPSETPANFVPRIESFDYTKREVMIPMRDGVKLQTVILVPRGAHRAPILLSRTPYGATSRIAKNASAHLNALLDSNDVADQAVLDGGYIRVEQDVRGKHGSEGDYVMTRPLQGPLNPTNVDHSTDTYDTIDWLIKN